MNNYNIDELLNIIELMKQSLIFYSDKNNHINDNGNQANMIINQVDNLLKSKQNYQEELDEYLKNNKIEDNIDEFIKNI
jgi:arginyl-tRNA synthetase